jgi:hypothetical protein
VPNFTTISGQIIELNDLGYTAKEVYLEMKQRPGCGKLTQARVNAVLRQTSSRTEASRQVFEIREMMIEALAILREMRTDRQQREVAQRVRALERKDLPRKLGAAIERLNPELAEPDSPA